MPEASSELHSTLEQSSKKDTQTVTADGKDCRMLIDGVVLHDLVLHDLVLHTDERGTVCEMYDPRWGINSDPLVFTYFYTIRPGWAKGWGMHKQHEDRYCMMQGEMKVVLYDSRQDSPTHGMVNEINMTEHRRQLLVIPRGVWHADENLGTGDVLVVNFPTIQYDHRSPDKYRLPLDTDLIPYKFHPSIRW